MLNHRLIGGILLVAGTSIGAGMLALPVISSFGGFVPSFFLLAICWLFLLLTSFLFLDVNLTFPGKVNLITMADKTLGFFGKAVCWLTYLLLLYSLTAAYIAGSAPLFLEVFQYATGFTLPSWLGPLPLLILFGFFVYLGTKAVDWLNRLLMFGLILTYFLLVGSLPSHVHLTLLSHVDVSAMWVAIPVLITSYGFHIIIPTLTTYLNHDKKKLRLTLLIGSSIPFLVYAIWQFLILSVVPLTGEKGLIFAYVEGQTSAFLLAHVLENSWIAIIVRSFSFFAILTSFLGVSLSLSDFLTDGLQMKRFSLGKEFACLFTFVPPLIFALTYQRGFILALEFAGIFVAILLCILPALMAWKLPSYRTFFKRSVLILVILLSLGVIILDILEEMGSLKHLTSAYLPSSSP